MGPGGLPFVLAEGQHVHDRDDDGTDEQAEDRRGDGVGQPAEHAAEGAGRLVDELLEVSGIGPAKLAQLKDQVQL